MKAEPNPKGAPVPTPPSWTASLALAAALLLPLVAAVALPALAGPFVAVDRGGAEPAERPAGQRIFLAQKCNTCHGIEVLGIEAKTKSEKLRGKDLSTVGSRHSAEEIATYLARESAIEGKKHKKEFKGSDEELQAVARWLGTLKKR